MFALENLGLVITSYRDGNTYTHFFKIVKHAKFLIDFITINSDLTLLT